MSHSHNCIALALAACGLSLLGLSRPSYAADTSTPPASTWDVMSDTWVATDALGRKLPTHDQVGSPRKDKFVGIFYFLWLGRHGEEGPFDISKNLLRDPAVMQNPKSPLWGPLYAPHHWGESIFDYYISDDPGVLRKHAQMLADAGVDVVIFDVTNNLTYPQSWQALGRVFSEMRRQGCAAPRIAFLCPFWDPKKVVLELWDELYSKGTYRDLWFQWEGKPLILADPALLTEGIVQADHDAAVALEQGHSLGQSFAPSKPFGVVSACLPTWETKDTAVTMTLYRDGPGGKQVAQQRVENIGDNAWVTLELKSPEPAGTYYLELTDPNGHVGWWSLRKDRIPGGSAFVDGKAAPGDRTLRVNLADERIGRIRQFFTFRKPQADYFTGPRGPGEWGWLEVSPQHVFYKTPGVPEQMTVGVAQNALEGKLSVLSNPRSHGRSFHDGKQPEPSGQDSTGRNVAEQWKRALEVDPPFIFITGWNEWIAGRFNEKAPFHGSGPVTFVDQFNTEYSRDIEPMKGGHGDNYYYQMVAHIRR
ncbi:MAG TPA: hypothetical protein VHP11_02005, partial [Tepidisphaeraceae bacterium]|nr:hypothetical protein [Tepidisphaeraceae bacterium]